MREMLFAIFEDIIFFFNIYATVGGQLACLAVGGFIGYSIWKNRNQKICISNLIDKVMCIFLLVMYVYIVVGITILSRTENETRGASFQLFRTFWNYFMGRKQIYENILMFVPYAVLLYGLAKPFRKLGICLLMGAGSSLLIEITQWVTRTGYFEVDDILTNTIGMLIGYMISYMIEKIYKRIKKSP